MYRRTNVKINIQTIYYLHHCIMSIVGNTKSGENMIDSYIFTTHIV